MFMWKYFHFLRNKWEKERSMHMHTKTHSCPCMYKGNHEVIHSVPQSAAFWRVQYWGTFSEKSWLQVQWMVGALEINYLWGVL